MAGRQRDLGAKSQPKRASECGRKTGSKAAPISSDFARALLPAERLAATLEHPDLAGDSTDLACRHPHNEDQKATLVDLNSSFCDDFTDLVNNV